MMLTGHFHAFARLSHVCLFFPHDAGEPLLVSVLEAQVSTEDAQKRMRGGLKSASRWEDVIHLRLGWGDVPSCIAYVGWEPVGGCGLVDVVLVVVCVGTALRGLPLPPANRAALHHAAAQLGRCLLRGAVRVAVLCHHAGSRGRRGDFSLASSPV